MRARTKKGFWRRVAVWWAAGTVVLVGLEGGAVWWLAKRVNTKVSRPHGAGWLIMRVDHSEQYSSAFDVDAGPDVVTFGLIYPIYADINYAAVPPIISTSDGSLDSLNDAEIRTQFPAHVLATRRLRDVLGSIRRANGLHTSVWAIDIACVIPVGMVVRGTPYVWGGEPHHALPGSLRTMYPVVITLEPGLNRVLVHWNAIVVAGAVSAMGVGMWPAVGRMRRHARARRGACAACGYSLVGIAGDAPCPECGSKRE